MPTEQEFDSTSEAHLGWKATLLICGAVALAGGLLIAVIFQTEPGATREGATRKTAMMVDVTAVEAGDFRPTIVAMGTVKPSQDIVLRPRVSGEIVERFESFTPGRFVEKGETLLRIDQSDYRNALQQRDSELRQAIADLRIEEGQQNIAENEYRLLEEKLSPERKALVLRQPQLNAAQASVAAARAAVEQAQLELRRTDIKAPFDAQVLNRNVNLGSQVSAGENLGRLVGVDAYWVEATVPLSKVQWLTFPGDRDEQGSPVRLRNNTAWAQDQFRTGYLFSLIGELNENTRLARVLIAVEDPFAREDSSQPPLMLGTFVENRIRGKTIANVVRLNRKYVRNNDTAWVADNKELVIRDLDVVFQDHQYAYVREGLKAGDQVITTTLATVTEGAELRIKSSESASAQESADE